MKKKLLLIVLIIVLSLVATSCDSTQTTTSKKDPNDIYPRAVNNKEAALLARTLFNNTELGNATFTLKCGTLGTGGFLGEGLVDWKSSVVAIRVALMSADQINISSIATNDGVFESVLNLNDTLTNAGYGSFNWVKRVFDPSQYGIDSLSQFILKLGATSPDNPILIKQNGATILGVEIINNIKTYKMRNSGTVTYYVGDDDTLVRLEANIKGFSCPLLVDFVNQGATTIDVPDDVEAISLDEVSDLYKSIRPSF
jgi:hypothetical protein